MEEVIIPTHEEVIRWLLEVVKHSSHVEYFLNNLDLGKEDPERPHDLVGPGNKFEWDMIKGFALQYREPKVDFDRYIQSALTLHRQQYHHRMWNEPNPYNKNFPIKEASIQDMLLGALDANCALLENRSYQGGAHDYEKIAQVALKNPPHRGSWMLTLIPMMQRIEQPRLEMIKSLDNIPNIGLNEDIYKKIQDRTKETLEMLATKGYHL